jgi:fatty acid amide hydrolase 2
MGLTDNGLPLGVQVVAAAGHDHVSIAVALELERAVGGWVDPQDVDG